MSMTSTEQKQEKEKEGEEYLHLKIPLHKFSDREEIKSVISNSILATKSKNDNLFKPGACIIIIKPRISIYWVF